MTSSTKKERHCDPVVDSFEECIPSLNQGVRQAGTITIQFINSTMECISYNRTLIRLRIRYDLRQRTQYYLTPKCNTDLA